VSPPRDLLEDRLRRYQEMALEVLLALVPAVEPAKYLYDLVPSYPKRAGKGLRPALCIATCRALSGNVEQVVHSAAALELAHNAFLVHDDVEDGSALRRGLPTLHAEHGVAIAINVGDAMNVLSLRPLMLNLPLVGPQVAWLVFNEFEHMVRQSVEGQAIELGWVRDNVVDLTDADYLRMSLKKTCWYTCIHPCRIGALIAQGSDEALDRFNRFGYFMGAAFQIQDDLLNLEGAIRYGKEWAGDVFEGKRTLMLIHLLNHSDAGEKRRLREFMSLPRDQRTTTDVAWVLERMDAHDSLAYGRSCARGLAGAALSEFERAYGSLPDSDDRRMVRDVIRYMVERDV
jgi:geranylgeranyl diphosphate synthase, type II